jgi:hypothetical protein
MRENQVSKIEFNANIQLPHPLLTNSVLASMSRRAPVVPDKISSGTILIREGTALPEALPFKSEPYLSGWRLVKDLDGDGLGRKIQEAGWAIFCLAGEINVTVFGFDEQKTVQRAIARVLANPRSEKFNSWEVTRLASAASKRFLGVTYVTVSARSRHIQEGPFLFRAKDVQEPDRASLAAAWTKA